MILDIIAWLIVVALACFVLCCVGAVIEDESKLSAVGCFKSGFMFVVPISALISAAFGILFAIAWALTRIFS